jgi:hypothetical protein
MEMTEELAWKVAGGGPDAIGVVRALYADFVGQLDGFESKAKMIMDAATKLPLVWIHVSERLPEPRRTVLLTDGSDVTIAEFVDQDGWSAWHMPMNWRGALAWMPLPAPPKEDE